MSEQEAEIDLMEFEYTLTRRALRQIKAEAKAEGLRQAADLLQFTADPPHIPTWLRHQADLVNPATT
jgi:hypothetical protein